MNLLEPNKEEFFRCRCYSDEHTLNFSLDTEDEYGPFLYAHIFINTYDNIFKRIWTGIKYVFKYKCKYGHWDEWILNETDAKRMRNMLDEFIRLEEAKKIKWDVKAERPIIPQPAAGRKDGLEDQTS